MSHPPCDRQPCYSPMACNAFGHCRYREEGPVLIVDGRGSYPSNLNRAVEEQAAYYRRAKT